MDSRPTIAEAQAAVAPKQEVQETPKQVGRTADKNISIPDEVWAYFGVEAISDRIRSDVKSKINNILAYLNEKNPSAQIGDLIYEIQNIENKLAVPPLGVRRFDHIFQYIELNRQVENLEKRKKNYIKNG